MQGLMQERQVQADVLRELERDLHDLCQPITSLQCRLELGKVVGGEMVLLEAVDGALEDSARIFAGVARMRERLLAAADGDEGKAC
jgi:hypothetical protein